MLDNLKRYDIILASNSPRRRELLQALDIDFTVKVLDNIKEDYPDDLSAVDTAKYIAAEKAAAYKDLITDKQLVITADTIVVLGDIILGKPKDRENAIKMLEMLSGKTHQVVTGVSLMTKEKTNNFAVVTDVTFDNISKEDIEYYVDNYKPYDKAGAYGIQEWIGHIAVSRLNGSYFNVMGFPVQRIYKELQNF